MNSTTLAYPVWDAEYKGFIHRVEHSKFGWSMLLWSPTEEAWFWVHYIA